MNGLFPERASNKVNIPDDTDTFPLFPVQKSLLKILENPNHWNLSYLLFKKPGWRKEPLAEVLRELSLYHEAFSFRFFKKNTAFFQRRIAHPFTSCLFEEINVMKATDTAAAIDTEMINAQGKIHIFSGPVLVLQLYKAKTGDFLYLVTNHLLFDGISFKIIVGDIFRGYNQCEQRKEICFHKKTGSYPDALTQIYEFSQSRVCMNEIAYWENILDSVHIANPAVRPLKRTQRIERNMADIKTVILSPEECHESRQILRTHEVGAFACYLTIMGRTLCAFYNIPGIIIHLVNHGRNWEIGPLTITRTLGPFWLTFPVYISPGASGYPLDEITETQHLLECIPHSGRGYEIVKEIVLENTEFNKKADSLPYNILFNFIGFINEFTNFTGDDECTVSTYMKDYNRHPDAACPYSLIINLRRISKTLHLQIIYNMLEYSRAEINHLSLDFKKQLKYLMRILNSTEQRKAYDLK
ncbi:MAG: hypothetical protein JW881_15555 [Spirochaetales bacterium]|nr:hypothetical protein [Spirochaetales bacterium]